MHRLINLLPHCNVLQICISNPSFAKICKVKIFHPNEPLPVFFVFHLFFIRVDHVFHSYVIYVLKSLKISIPFKLYAENKNGQDLLIFSLSVNSHSSAVNF